MRVDAPHGRTLEVHEEGDPEGLPVIVHHGTPMAGLQYEPHAELAREQGIRLIGYDRPGYGGSTRDSGRRVADCVADVTAKADALGLDRFASWGVSGGPYVLACAALCDGRLTAVASLAAVAPWPTLLVHGDDDRFVPISHGRWLAGRIRHAEAWIDSGDGHLTLFESRMREVNEWLLSHS